MFSTQNMHSTLPVLAGVGGNGLIQLCYQKPTEGNTVQIQLCCSISVFHNSFRNKMVVPFVGDICMPVIIKYM